MVGEGPLGLCSGTDREICDIYLSLRGLQQLPQWCATTRSNELAGVGTLARYATSGGIQVVLCRQIACARA